MREYEIENYGSADFAEAPQILNGEFRRERSLMPFDYLDKRAKDFNWEIYGERPDEAVQFSNAFIVNFPEFQKKGLGFYIYSDTKGSGKTLLSCCLANEIMNRFDISVKFISILDYLDLTKKGYNSTAGKEEIESIKKAGILIIDDMGVEVNKDWVSSTLYQMINYRCSGKLITIITSNHSIENLDTDERIKSRISDMCMPLHLPEVPVRNIMARKRNEEFIKSILS